MSTMRLRDGGKVIVTKRGRHVPVVGSHGCPDRARYHAGCNDAGLFTDDEREFMLAVEKYKRERHRPFPAASECLAVLVSLGYRKVAEPTALPGRPGGLQ